MQLRDLSRRGLRMWLPTPSCCTSVRLRSQLRL